MPDQDEADRYRGHAATLRKMAEEASDEDRKQSFRRAAEYYEKKAASLEREAKSALPKG